MKYEKDILYLFISRENNRPSITEPFLQNGKVCATDGHVLIRIDAALCQETYPETVNDRTPPNTDQVVPAPTCNELLTQKMLSDAWAKLPEEEKNRRCPDCLGDGNVTWQYMGLDGAYTRIDECPVCAGTGIVSPYCPIKCLFTIHNHPFAYGHIKLLSRVMTYLEVDKLILRHVETILDPPRPMLFGVEDRDIDIVLMPIIRNIVNDEIPII